MLTLNGLCAAHGVAIIPMQCEYYALEGLSDLANTIKKVSANLNPDLKIVGLLRVMFDPRMTLSQQVSDQLEQHFGDKVFKTLIPRNVRLAKPLRMVFLAWYSTPRRKARRRISRSVQKWLKELNNWTNKHGHKKTKGLGRGLDALLGGAGDFAEAVPTVSGAPTSLPVTQMQAGKYQPRTRMDEGALTELAASIKAQGLMQPILVRPVGQSNGVIRYEIIAGERRFRASQMAGLDEVPVLVKDVDDQAAAAKR
jgi:hypothetical protein